MAVKWERGREISIRQNRGPEKRMGTKCRKESETVYDFLPDSKTRNKALILFPFFQFFWYNTQLDAVWMHIFFAWGLKTQQKHSFISLSHYFIKGEAFRPSPWFKNEQIANWAAFSDNELPAVWVTVSPYVSFQPRNWVSPNLNI